MAKKQNDNSRTPDLPGSLVPDTSGLRTRNGRRPTSLEGCHIDENGVVTDDFLIQDLLGDDEVLPLDESPYADLWDRVEGCLLGGACGDALGAPVEFLSLPEIRASYGPQGITALDTAYGRVGAVTDDTQMTLFTVEGLIRAMVRQDAKGICHLPSVVHHAYLRWLATQDESFETVSARGSLDGWLIKERRLWARRAPGNTCLSALRSNQTFGELANNNSKGCGAVMRAAPFGFLAMQMSVGTVFDLAVESARTTHGHPSGYLAAGALASIIHNLIHGVDLRSAVERTLPLLRAQKDQEVGPALENSLRLSHQADWRGRLGELGQGWVAEEAIEILASSLRSVAPTVRFDEISMPVLIGRSQRAKARTIAELVAVAEERGVGNLVSHFVQAASAYGFKAHTRRWTISLKRPLDGYPRPQTVIGAYLDASGAGGLMIGCWCESTGYQPRRPTGRSGPSGRLFEHEPDRHLDGRDRCSLEKVLTQQIS